MKHSFINRLLFPTLAATCFLAAGCLSGETTRSLSAISRAKGMFVIEGLDVRLVTFAGLDPESFGDAELRRVAADITRAGARSLNLEGTAVTDESVPLLASLPHVERLTLMGTRVTPGGIVTLARASKHLTMIFVSPDQAPPPTAEARVRRRIDVR